MNAVTVRRERGRQFQTVVTEKRKKCLPKVSRLALGTNNRSDRQTYSGGRGQPVRYIKDDETSGLPTPCVASHTQLPVSLLLKENRL